MRCVGNKGEISHEYAGLPAMCVGPSRLSFHKGMINDATKEAARHPAVFQHRLAHRDLFHN